jgi:hypothetical protein
MRKYFKIGESSDIKNHTWQEIPKRNDYTGLFSMTVS